MDLEQLQRDASDACRQAWEEWCRDHEYDPANYAAKAIFVSVWNGAAEWAVGWVRRQVAAEYDRTRRPDPK